MLSIPLSSSTALDIFKVTKVPDTIGISRYPEIGAKVSFKNSVRLNKKNPAPAAP